MNIAQKHIRGFTLIETVVSIGIFVLLAMSVYEISASVVRLTTVYRANVVVSQLANQYMEVVHNLPYSQVGTISGNPPGNMPDLPNAATASYGGVTYQIYYVVNYIDDPADGTFPTDVSANDYKQVKLYIKNTTTGLIKSFVTNIVPKGLEGLDSGGALSIKVFDAVGQPVPNASVNITNTTTGLNVTRTTDTSGNWVEVALPASSNDYHIVVTKSGYSTDQTYPITGGNPNPTKPDATILAGQITSVSFAIDHTSTLMFYTLNQTCSALTGIGLNIQGSKLIGTGPDVLKFNNSYTSNTSGAVPLSNLEWDDYFPYLSSATYMVYGTSPVQQVNILPGASQNFNLILGPITATSLLVIVSDAGSGAPIEGATVDLQSIASGTDNNKITGGSSWSQSDWTGGAGQVNFTDPTKYSSGSGISNDTPLTGLQLFYDGVSSYTPSGEAISSSFDTGSPASVYTTLSWTPTSQNPATSLKLQIATNNDDLTWNYLGPDGTGSSYYTVPGTTVSSVNNTGRYISYKAFFSTTDTSVTPVLSSITMNYVSGCYTPGQVIFPGILSGSGNYNLIVSAPGYQTQTINNITVSGQQVTQVQMSP